MLPDLAQAALEDAQAQLAASQSAAADGESRMLEMESNLARHKAVCAVRSHNLAAKPSDIPPSEKIYMFVCGQGVIGGAVLRYGTFGPEVLWSFTSRFYNRMLRMCRR